MKNWDRLWVAGLLLVAAVVHFHNPAEVFSRKLISIDDDGYVMPVGQVTSFTDYFTRFLPDRTNFAYPLRDLTIAMDYKIGSMTGLQTFWLTNFLIFALTFYFRAQIFQLIFPRKPWLRAGLLSVLALHPFNVEMIQWATARKHLLVIAVITWGSLHVIRHYLDDEKPLGWSDFWRVFGTTMLGLMAWPSALFWPLGVIWLLRRKLARQKAPIFALVVASCSLIVLTLKFVTVGVAEYANYKKDLATSAGLVRAFGWIWRSAGRATFDTILPVRLTTFYDMYSILNIIGLILFIALLGVLVWVSRKTREVPASRERTRLGWDLIVYSLFILGPQTLPVVGNVSFLWMAHYLYGELPFVLAALACFGELGLMKWLKERIHPLSMATAATLLLVFYVGITFKEIPRWHDAVTLMETCVEKEDSPFCMTLAMEKAFDANGCSRAFPIIERARKVYADRRSSGKLNHDLLFEIEMPLVDSLCTATATNLSIEKKVEYLNWQQEFYKRPISLVFARVLAFLSSHDLKSAWQVARSTYLDPNYVIDAPTEKILSLLSGQAEALCSLSQATRLNPECPKLLSVYRARTEPYLVDMEKRKQVQIAWSRDISINAFSASR